MAGVATVIYQKVNRNVTTRMTAKVSGVALKFSQQKSNWLAAQLKSCILPVQRLLPLSITQLAESSLELLLKMSGYNEPNYQHR